ncbi:ABC transporter permease [Microbacterium sp. 18062]|uniref:ABC transporter permease n=1 Tax=Microbacterium sp. 18062 TaxID=2681410 RepID=UPI00190F87C7|nr:ABC transporter permease [Microbacterium sp. 18062]
MTATDAEQLVSAPAARPRTARRDRPAGSHDTIQRYALPAILVILVVLCIAFIPEFRSPMLYVSMINGQSTLLLLALAATIVLRIGEFDLSIPQIMVGSAAIVAVLSASGVPAPVAGVLAVALGIVVGIVNGILVVVVGVGSFVTTLGTFTALAGFAYFVTGSQVITGVPAAFVDLARTPILGFPSISWIAWLLTAILWVVYERTPLGRYMLFIGGNVNAARLAGIRVRAIRLGSFIAAGALGGIIGVLFSGYLGAIDPSVGSQFMLQPFAAAFLGATAISIGRFNALGTVIALYTLTVGITALQIVGAQTWVSNVFYGLALIGAVTAARVIAIRATKRAAK